MATSNYQPIRRRHSDLPLAMSASYEAFLQSASVEVLAERCAGAAQEMGFSDENPPRTKAEQQAVLRKAWEIHRSRRWERRKALKNDISARRRARKLKATVEHFTRQEIIERDNRTCHICGRTELPDAGIHLDHVIPLSKGGDHSRANVKVACSECNIRKGDTMSSEALV